MTATTEFWALVAEAGGAIVLPCSATIVVTAILVALLGRGRAWTTVGLVGGTIAGAVVAVTWGWVPPDVVVGVALATGGGAVAWRSRATGTGRVVPAAGAALAGAAAGWLWQPCVGEQLGTVLNAGVRDPWSAVVPLAAFVFVLVLPAVLVSVAARSPRVRGWLDGLPVATTTVLVVGLGLAVTIGFGDDLTAALFRWST